jgi:hypothetical protein
MGVGRGVGGHSVEFGIQSLSFQAVVLSGQVRLVKCLERERRPPREALEAPIAISGLLADSRRRKQEN